MVLEISEDGRGARRGQKTSDSILSPALGKSLPAVDQEYSGLVHQPAGLVGTPHPGLVCESARPQIQSANLCRDQSAEGSGELDPGYRYARHLVFILAMGLRDHGLEDTEEVL